MGHILGRQQSTLLERDDKNPVKNNGDAANFENNWIKRQEKLSNWFCKGKAENQIQFAFQQHWSFIKTVINIPKNGKCLEVGCGRGSISSFFAEDGYYVSLLDISESIISDAKKIFNVNGHSDRTEFIVGDANNLPYDDNVFDVTISIGLLEHFSNVDGVISEQIRVLKIGGIFIAYVVPEKWSVQSIFKPLNLVLSKISVLFGSKNKKIVKTKLFRTKYDSKYYKKIINTLGQKHVKSSGVYPFPAISHSSNFPFSVMPHVFEIFLVSILKTLSSFCYLFHNHPWACNEKWGQAFFIWFIKQ